VPADLFSMQHLAINGSDLGRQRGGNESFILGLLQGIAQAGLPVRVTTLVSEAGAQVLRSIEYHGEVANYGSYHRIPYQLWQQTRLLENIHPDWYISTYFLPFRVPCSGAVIVHDVSFRAHPEYFPPVVSTYMRYLTGQAIRQARVVAFDSYFTACEAARYYPVVGDKGVITYPGIDPLFLQPVSEVKTVLDRYSLNPGYLLAIGNIHPRKNLERLLEAYLALKAELPSVPQMVWIGLPRWQSSALIKRAENVGIVLPGYVQAAHLPAIYRSARVFIYPSLYEGFGLPVLEAMASETPVICSSTTSLPEVAGDAALLVNPLDIAALKTAILSLLTDHELEQKLVARGLQQVIRFSYANTARTLYEALDKHKN